MKVLALISRECLCTKDKRGETGNREVSQSCLLELNERSEIKNFGGVTYHRITSALGVVVVVSWAVVHRRLSACSNMSRRGRRTVLAMTSLFFIGRWIKGG